MVINKFACPDTDVACVLYDHRISDLIPYCKTTCWVCILRDAQFCCSILCFHCRCRSDFCRIISTLRCSICLDNVYDLTCIYISLSHCVSVGKLSTFIRCESKCLITKVRMVIDQFASLDTDVACVLYDHRVSDLIPYCNTTCWACSLRDAQFCCCFFCRHFCCRSDFCRVVSTLRCSICLNNVNDLTCIYISLRNCVGVSEYCLLVWSKCKSLIT